MTVLAGYRSRPAAKLRKARKKQERPLFRAHCFLTFLTIDAVRQRLTCPRSTERTFQQRGPLLGRTEPLLLPVSPSASAAPLSCVRARRAASGAPASTDPAATGLLRPSTARSSPRYVFRRLGHAGGRHRAHGKREHRDTLRVQKAAGSIAGLPNTADTAGATLRHRVPR